MHNGSQDEIESREGAQNDNQHKVDAWCGVWHRVLIVVHDLGPALKRNHLKYSQIGV